MRHTLTMIALAALVSAPAIAAPAAEKGRTVRIAYSDLDVTMPEGRAAVEARINARLRKACTFDASRYTLGHPVVDEVCFADARTAALTELDRVVALKSRGGRTVAAN